MLAAEGRRQCWRSRRHAAASRRRDRRDRRRASARARLHHRAGARRAGLERDRCCRRPTRCRCASARTASSRISPRRAARGIEPPTSCACPASGSTSTGPRISRRLCDKSPRGTPSRSATLDRRARTRRMTGAASRRHDGDDDAQTIVPSASATALRRRGAGARRCDDLPALMRVAAALRDAGHGDIVTYSRKVFIPLTQLCRDVCHYCTFAHPPRRGERAYLTPRRGAGDRARRRGGRLQRGAVHARRQAGAALPRGARRAGARSATPRRSPISPRWRRWCCEETGLLPHVNPGVHDRGRYRALRKVSVSQGLMLESAAERLCAARRPAFRLARQGAGACGSRPSRRPARRRCRSPRGILIGIGETRARAHRGAAGAARPARALRPHPGNHHPEFPRQARHAHGGRARARRSTSISGPSPSRG